MADGLRRIGAWLGLVTDDRYADQGYADEVTEGVEFTDEVSAHTAATNVATLRRTGTEHSTPIAVHAGRTAVAAVPEDPPSRRPEPTPTSSPRTADLSRIITVTPRSFNEARVIGEHFRDGVPVIMNLSEMENADAKRLVDFAAGLILGLRGTIERVTSKVFLLSPHNVNVTAEDKERIVGGFFNQS